jgi:hypothetical protein
MHEAPWLADKEMLGEVEAEKQIQGWGDAAQQHSSATLRNTLKLHKSKVKYKQIELSF